LKKVLLGWGSKMKVCTNWLVFQGQRFLARAFCIQSPHFWTLQSTVALECSAKNISTTVLFWTEPICLGQVSQPHCIAQVHSLHYQVQNWQEGEGDMPPPTL
jgi:hypothetical protein